MRRDDPDPSVIGLGEGALDALPGLGLPLEARSIVAPKYAARDSAIRRFLLCADVVALVFGLAVAATIAGVPLQRFWPYLVFVGPFIVIFKSYGLYDRHVRRIAYSWIDEIPRVFHAVLVGTLLVWAATDLGPVHRLSARPMIGFAIATFVLVPVLRMVARSCVVSVLGRERVLLVGDDQELDLLARKIRSHPEYQLDLVGYLSHPDPLITAPDLRNLGDAREVDIPALVRLHDIGRVVLSRRGLDRDAVVDLIRSFNELRVKVSYLPQAFEGLGPSTELDDIEGVTVLGVNPPVMTRSSRALKRSMDLVGASLLLLLTLPLLMFVAASVKLSSPGPIFFRQNRIGRGGRRFKVLKFRTMVQDAESKQGELLKLSKDPNWLLLDHDPRITRIGRFLRRTSLDELPQLWNVIRGEMSLVGPRPIIESEDRQLEGWRRSRVDLTPGLTGMWQVLGRTSIPFEEMIKLDYLYVTNWSLWSDIRLILRTVPAVLGQRGVN